MTTDPIARDARWSAPLILAPCAAAVFGASVWWAANATPAATSSTATQPASTQVTRVSHQALAAQHHQTAVLHRALRRELRLQHRNAVDLQHRLQTLRAHLGNVHIALPPIPSGPVGNAPAPAPVPAAPAPPQVNTVTGASG